MIVEELGTLKYWQAIECLSVFFKLKFRACQGLIPFQSFNIGEHYTWHFASRPVVFMKPHPKYVYYAVKNYFSM